MGGKGLLAAGVRDGDAQKGVGGGRPHAEAVRMEDLDAVCAQHAFDLLSASRRTGQGQRTEEAHVVRRPRKAEDGIEHRVRAAGRRPLAFQQGLRRAVQDQFAEDFSVERARLDRRAVESGEQTRAEGRGDDRERGAQAGGEQTGRAREVDRALRDARLERGLRLGAQLRVVLQDEQVPRTRDLGKRVPPRAAHRPRRRVRAGRHEEDAPHAVRARRLLQRLRQHPLRVAPHGNEADLRHAREADEVAVGEFVNGQGLPHAEERQEGNRKDALHAGEDGDVAGGRLDADTREPAPAGLAHALRAVAFPVGEQPFGAVPREDRARGLHHRTGAEAGEPLHDAEIDGGPHRLLVDAGQGGDERAAPDHAVDEPLRPAEVEGARHRREVEFQVVRQLALGREARAGRKAPGRDVALQRGGERKVDGAAGEVRARRMPAQRDVREVMGRHAPEPRTCGAPNRPASAPRRGAG